MTNKKAKTEEQLEDDERGERAENASDGADQEDTPKTQTIGEGEHKVELPYEHPRSVHERRMKAAKAKEAPVDDEK